MTPARLADIHAAAMRPARPWSAAEFGALLADPRAFLLTEPTGFAIGRAVADEAELLTIAVAPEAQRSGLGRRLLSAFEGEAVRRRAATGHLEVAEDNAAALALYLAAGWSEAGRRPRYYPRDNAASADAVRMSKRLI